MSVPKFEAKITAPKISEGGVFKHKYFLLNERQVSIIIFYFIAIAISFIDNQFPNIFPKAKIPQSFSQLKNPELREEVSTAIFAKILIFIVAGYIFRDEMQFVMLSILVFQFLEDFFEIDDAKKTFKTIGGTKPYIFGGFAGNMYG